MEHLSTSGTESSSISAAESVDLVVEKELPVVEGVVEPGIEGVESAAVTPVGDDAGDVRESVGESVNDATAESVENTTGDTIEHIGDSTAEPVPEPEPTPEPITPEPTPMIPTFKGTPEMKQLSTFFYNLNNKFYYCGFVYKLNAVNVSGKPLFKNVTAEEQIQSDGYWSKWWMEQWGSVLHLWRVPDELSSFAYTTSLTVDRFIKNELDPPMELMAAIKSFQQSPVFINIADATIELFDAGFQSVGFQNTPSPPIPYTCHFSISTTCSNLYVFSVPSVIQANQWVASMRLALYETHKLNLTFTNRVMRKVTMVNGWHEFQVEPFQSHMFRGDVKFEGPLQVRIPYSNVWKQLHVVVTSKYGTEAYASNAGISKKIFKRKASMVDLSKRGSILFYPNKNTAAKGKPPLFVMYDVKWVNTIWPDEADEVKIEHLCMAKLQGSFRLYSLKQNDDLQLGRKTFENFAKGYPTMTGLETFAALFEGTDPRPVPEQLLIMTPSSADLSRWITAIWCSFSIDPAVAQLEDEIHEMTKLPDPPEGQVQPDMVKVEWPTQMYLSLNEVGGITMNPVSLFETFVQYSHYLQQKVNFSKQQKIRQWCEAVAKGEWERNICDRKEIDYKIKQLVDWSLKICEKLNQFGIETKKPHPTVLVAAMSSIVGWIGPVLSSMIDETPKSPIKASPSTSATTSTSDSGDVETSSSVSKPSTKKTVTTSGSEGSVSEEERSDDGSQSDGESEESLEQINLRIVSRPPSEISSTHEQSEFQVYAPNSLLAQVAENENLPRNAPKQAGPFITTKQGEQNAIQYPQNSLLSKPSQNRFSMGQGNARNSAFVGNIVTQNPVYFINKVENADGLVQKIGQTAPKKEIQGPLLGSLEELERKKPKLQGGLLGEMDRRAKEVEYMKKTGYYRSTGVGLVNYNPESDYNREMFRQHMLAQERIRSTGGADLKAPIIQMNSLIQQLSNSLMMAQDKNPQLVQSLQRIVQQMSVVMVQFNSNVDNANGLPLAGPMNPYAVPNVSWKISNSTSATSSVSSVSHGRNRATKYPSSQDSSEYDSDGSRIHSSSYKSTSGTESASVQSFRSGSTETPTSATDSLDDDVPLIKQLKKGASPKKQLHSSTETDSSEDSSEGSTDDSDSSEGSQSESDSDESIDVPLGILASGTSTSFSSSNSNVPRPLSYQPPIASTGQQSNYQKYLMNQTNIYAQQNYSARTANPVRTSTPQSFVQSQSLSRSEQGARSNESLTATPKPKRKVLKEADSSEGSLSDESQPDII